MSSYIMITIRIHELLLIDCTDSRVLDWIEGEIKNLHPEAR